jgi:alpha-aminoadipate carrier protein LysW
MLKGVQHPVVWISQEANPKSSAKAVLAAKVGPKKEYCKIPQPRLDWHLPDKVEVSPTFWVHHYLLKKFTPEVEKVPTGTCPECDADVHVDMDTDKGDTVSCEECGVELEVVGLDPVELDIVEEEALDDDEDDD